MVLRFALYFSVRSGSNIGMRSQRLRKCRLDLSSETSVTAADFQSVLDRRVSKEQWEQACSRRVSKAGRPPKIPRSTIVTAVLFHFLNAVGTLGHHFEQMTGKRLAESSLADRRATLPREVFDELLSLILRPLGQASDSEAVWRAKRLVGIDGTLFSLTNTPQNHEHAPKAKTRRGRAAFVKFSTVVLLELGLHNPLAAALGYEAQSEWALALSLIGQLPANSLLLGDRLFGCPAFVGPLLARAREIGSDFLIRVKDVTSVSAPKRKVKRCLGDGTALVELTVVKKKRIVERITVREICAVVQRARGKPVNLRFWTSLLDPVGAPAIELVGLYARRWEHELYWKEIKLQLRKSEVLQSHTPHTASQEIAAMIILSSLLAEERASAAAEEIPVLRISFARTLDLIRPLWLIMQVGGDLFSPEQKKELVARLRQQLRNHPSQRRRQRSCRRSIRQPQKVWPRTMQPESHEGPLSLNVLEIAKQ